MSTENKSNVTPLIAFAVISVAVAGYFTGLQSPMNPVRSESPRRIGSEDFEHRPNANNGVIPATHYAEMAAAMQQREATRLASLKSVIDPLAEVKIEPQEKLAALQQRRRNRAFNGAPPTTPHPIEQRSDASCVACHLKGAKSSSLRIPRMSHALLTNCTQCHVESNPRHMAAAVFRENAFQGLEAPREGPRSFDGAPPLIPHSTWMRSDCMSCHGYEGLHGLRTTHPWRNNCQQCHAPSATLDQTLLATEPRFLPGPQITE